MKSGNRRRTSKFRAYKRRLFSTYGLCFYCQRRPTQHNPKTVDHLVNLSDGGTNVGVNLVVACRSCNMRKEYVGLARHLDDLWRLGQIDRTRMAMVVAIHRNVGRYLRFIGGRRTQDLL